MAYSEGAGAKLRAILEQERIIKCHLKYLSSLNLSDSIIMSVNTIYHNHHQCSILPE